MADNATLGNQLFDIYTNLLTAVNFINDVQKQIEEFNSYLEASMNDILEAINGINKLPIPQSEKDKFNSYCYTYNHTNE